jgi:hypothetical protein
MALDVSGPDLMSFASLLATGEDDIILEDVYSHFLELLCI